MKNKRWISLVMILMMFLSVALAVSISIPMSTTASSTGDELGLSNNYEMSSDREKYQIWKLKKNATEKLMAIWRDIAVKYDSATKVIKISATGINGDYGTYTTVFDSTNFYGLIPGSTINSIVIIPHTRDLTAAGPQTGEQWRVCVFTNLGQIYHNNPSYTATGDGPMRTEYYSKWDESYIWDLPVNKYPSSDPAASGTERYFPGLPAAAYEYHPAPNTNLYGNPGYGKSRTIDTVTYPRFYIPLRAAETNSFKYMNGFETDDQITILGTYGNTTSGKGTRIGVFMTDDGGRNWFLKQEFANNGTTGDTYWGNNINTTGMSTAYKDNSFVFIKRTLNFPTETVKEPTTMFTLSTPQAITSISKGNPAVVQTASAHGLETGNIIAFRDNTSNSNALSPDWNWMRNDSISPTYGGTGMLFKVKKLTDTTFELHEQIHSAYTNIPCRHIHSINTTKDGWILGTGEEYPEGWIYTISKMPANSDNVALAHEKFNAARLNSAEYGVQRIMGAVITDDPVPLLIFASDCDSLWRARLKMPAGRTETSYRSSVGIFKGPLSGINGIYNYNVLCEVQQTSYLFKKKAGVLIFVGQIGEVALSFDEGASWIFDEAVDADGWGMTSKCGGESNNVVLLDKFILVLK